MTARRVINICALIVAASVAAMLVGYLAGQVTFEALLRMAPVAAITTLFWLAPLQKKTHG